MRIGCALVLLLTFTASASAQHASNRFASVQDTAIRVGSSWSPIRIAKWSTLLASTSAAAYGFAQNRIADRDYEDIERQCLATLSSCDRKTGSDVYADATLEERYQTVVRRDDRAKVALLAGQVGLAASVLMFIIDLPKGTGPQDIPYEPHPLQVGFTSGQLLFSFRLPAH